MCFKRARQRFRPCHHTQTGNLQTSSEQRILFFQCCLMTKTRFIYYSINKNDIRVHDTAIINAKYNQQHLQSMHWSSRCKENSVYSLLPGEPAARLMYVGVLRLNAGFLYVQQLPWILISMLWFLKTSQCSNVSPNTFGSKWLRSIFHLTTLGKMGFTAQTALGIFVSWWKKKRKSIVSQCFARVLI